MKRGIILLPLTLLLGFGLTPFGHATNTPPLYDTDTSNIPGLVQYMQTQQEQKKQTQEKQGYTNETNKTVEVEDDNTAIDWFGNDLTELID
jgi:hypothetical protein